MPLGGQTGKMKKTNTIKKLVVAAMLGLGLAAPLAGPAQAKDFGTKMADPVAAKECSACHVAYPPYLLPQRSWKALMNGLSDHFGEDAWLPEETRKHIEDYLMSTAGDAGDNMFAKMFMRKIPKDSTPLRISDLKSFKGDHNGVTGRFPDLWEKAGRSWAQCDACHARAAEGKFED